MINDNQYNSPNILGMLAGLVTILILGSIVTGVIWMLVTAFSPWATL